MSGTYRVLPWLPNHLPTSMQSFSIIHHISFFNVQSVSLQGGGQQWGGWWRQKEVFFSKNEESEPSPGTVHLTLPHWRVMGGSSRAGWRLSSVLSWDAYRVLCNSQYSWSSVRYLTPRSPAGWVRGRGAFKAGSWCREFLLSVVVGFTRFEAWTTALANAALSAIFGGRRGGGEEGKLEVKTKMEYSKNTSLQVE